MIALLCLFSVVSLVFGKYDPNYDYGGELPQYCQQTMSSPAKSVHKLTPRDVKIVAALGDSMTVGNGIKADILGASLVQYRGLSFSIGGDSDLKHAVTLPNILKEFNPYLIGYSIGTGIEIESSKSQFNMATPYSYANDLKDQAKSLVSRLNSDQRIQPANDWKVITVFIGGNDLCDSCVRKGYSPEDYKNNLRDALDYLHGHVSRAFVNLVSAPPVHEMRKHASDNVGCRIMYWSQCQCVIPIYKDRSAALLNRTLYYRKAAQDLIKSRRYDSRDDFTVVIQPMVENVQVPMKGPHDHEEIDFSFQAPDCFHLSQKGHESLARSLWNNMFQQEGYKSSTWTKYAAKEALTCPDWNRPYFRTYNN